MLFLSCPQTFSFYRKHLNAPALSPRHSFVSAWDESSTKSNAGFWRMRIFFQQAQLVKCVAPSSPADSVLMSVPGSVFTRLCVYLVTKSHHL